MSFIHKGIFVAGGQMFGIFLNMLVGVLFSRVLGKDGMGQYELFRSTAVLAATLGALGLGNSAIYFINSVKQDRKIITTLSFRTGLAMGCLLAGCLFIMIRWGAGYFGVVPISTTLVYSLGVGAFVSTSILRQILVAHLASRKLVIVDLMNRMVLISAGVVLVLCHILTTDIAIIVFAAGHIAAASVVIFLLRKDIDIRISPHWAVFKKLIGYGVKLAAANIMYLLCAQITVLLLRYLTEDEDFGDIGLYTRAVAVAGMANIAYAAIAPLIFSRLSKANGTERIKLAERAGRIGSTVGLLSGITVCVFGRYIIQWLYGVEYIGATTALQILAFSTATIPLLSVINSLLAVDGKALVTAKILIGTLIVVTLIIVALVSRIGIAGAAVAALAGNIFTMIVGLVVCHKLYRLHPLDTFLCRPRDIRYVLQAMVRARH